MAVSVGAFGAHGLKAALAGRPPEEAAKVLGWVETGSRIQLAHACALLALAALAPRLGAGLAWPARLLFWGSLAFSASLYALALGAPSGAAALAPVGGTAMLAGWAWLAVLGFRTTEGS